MLLLTESTIHFLNFTFNCSRKNPDFTLSSKVQNWTSDVKSFKSRGAASTSLASNTSFASPPPSTLFSHLTSSSSQSEVPCFSEAKDDLVGGFGDDDDDTLERQAACQLKDQRGRAVAVVLHFLLSWSARKPTDPHFLQTAAVTLAVDSDSESDNLKELEEASDYGSDGPQAPFTQLPPSAPSATSLRKRKATEVLVVSESETDDSGDDYAVSDPAMLVDNTKANAPQANMAMDVDLELHPVTQGSSGEAPVTVASNLKKAQHRTTASVRIQILI